GSVAGSYLAKDADAEEGIIRIIKGVAKNNAEPERVIIHEIGHHLEQFVDDAEYQALRSQWEREMGTGGGILPGSGQGGQMLVDDVQPLHDNLPKKPFEENPVAMTPENYRYQGGFGEWFAENIADRALRDYADDAIDVGPWKRAWQNVQEFASTVYRWLLRRGEKDAAERVYRNIMEGKYG
ncbi:hypothetical protein, partial [Escherichia coli]|uniref:hypothetical protein n=1 Tax=Escherichia coli TaxID=562 RepID=UPI0022F2C148